jgi:hypothetical protein
MPDGIGSELYLHLHGDMAHGLRLKTESGLFAQRDDYGRTVHSSRRSDYDWGDRHRAKRHSESGCGIGRDVGGLLGDTVEYLPSICVRMIPATQSPTLTALGFILRASFINL